MQNNLSRRAVLGGLAALGLGAAAPKAHALTTGQAEQLIERVVAEILSSINKGGSEAQLLKAFEQIFVRYADVPTIARAALGPDARSASSAQLRAFSKAFQTYISRKYGRRFREFIGGRIEVRDARAVKSFFEVRCTAVLKGEAPFDVTFLVSDRSGQDKFFDMLIEGISLLKTERTEIGALLDKRRGNLDQLIKDLPGLA